MKAIRMSNHYQIHNNNSKHLFAEKISSQLSTKDASGIRPELQGLRAVAILAVLLFHMWNATFPVGYLGVDCFFVISGYLMIMLLSREQSLKFSDILMFYYRRIKRIVPVYLFVVFITLISCYFLIARLEYDQVVSESIPSLFFYSNFPFVHKFDYFNVKSRYQFLLHTWSLSCELQFYLFVPFLMMIIVILNGIGFCLTLLFIFTLCFISFWCQVNSKSNAKHMTLDGRIWQFLFGFIAHFVYQSKLLNWSGGDVKSKRWYRLFMWSRNTTPTILLIFMLICPAIDMMEQQVQRFLVVFITSLIISIRQDGSALSNKLFVSLGDVSYSVYLVHWPMFTMCRYLDPKTFGDSTTEVNYKVGACLIFISIAVGYLVETRFKRLLTVIKTWKQLIRVLLVFYLAITVSLLVLHTNALEKVITKTTTSMNNEQRIADTLMLWETRDSGVRFSNKEALRLNQEISTEYQICINDTKVLDTTFPYVPGHDERICHELGTGTKNIIIFGNSHAYLSYFGIAHVLKPIAKEITLIAKPACIPSSKYHQYHQLNAQRRKNCEKFISDAIKAMQQFRNKIDIIIPLFGWFQPSGFPMDRPTQLKDEIQDNFNKLSDLVGDVVFAPRMHLRFSSNLGPVYLEALKLNRTIDTIGEEKKDLYSFHSTARNALDSIKCPKCLKIDSRDLWCRGTDNFCSIIDKRGILYFTDDHHQTTYGSAVLGNYFLEVYKHYMEEKIT